MSVVVSLQAVLVKNLEERVSSMARENVVGW